MMLLREYITMAVDDYKCYVWDGHINKNIFEGWLSDIPEELLDREITSWELDNHNRIGLNII